MNGHDRSHLVIGHVWLACSILCSLLDAKGFGLFALVAGLASLWMHYAKRRGPR